MKAAFSLLPRLIGRYGLPALLLLASVGNGLAQGTPPTITTQPQSQTVPAASTVTFSVTVSGTEPLFYQWQRQLFEHGTRAFEAPGSDRTQNRLERQIAGLEARLTRKHEVLSELMEEHIRLKKELGES